MSSFKVSGPGPYFNRVCAACNKDADFCFAYGSGDGASVVMVFCSDACACVLADKVGVAYDREFRCDIDMVEAGWRRAQGGEGE